MTDEEKQELFEKFVQTLPDPDLIGKSEYRAVVELVMDCDDLQVAHAACMELVDQAHDMLDRIELFRDDPFNPDAQ